MLKRAIAPAILAAIGILLGYLWSFVEMPTITGTWRDVHDENYFVVFYDDGTFVESDFNIPREYEQANNILTYYDVTGELHKENLRENYRARITMTINGKTHVLQPTEERAKLATWDNTLSGSTIAAYKMANDLGVACYLRLFDDNAYRITFGDREIIGKYVITASDVLYLLDSTGGVVERWEPWAAGYKSYLLDGELYTVELEDPIRGTKTNALRGEVHSVDLGLRYEFDEDGTVIVTLAGSSRFEFEYSVTSDGLVTLSDSEGAGVADCLLYSQETGRVYRYVLTADGWFDYLGR